MGGGFEIALACDLIVASEQAVFALPEPRIGLAAGAGEDAQQGRHRGPEGIRAKTQAGLEAPLAAGARGTIPSAAIALQSLAHHCVRPQALTQGVD
jgi:enoyl-CoA hydratase/carnithine racemase